MKLLRVVVSDLHLGSGRRRGELNILEDFFHDDHLVELLAYYDRLAGADTEIELIMNGDIFDLLKIKIEGKWPLEITDEIATEKLKQCLEGHPKVIHALREFLSRPNRRLTYLPGNHDLDMWFPGPQELFRRYIGALGPDSRVRFITGSDTYYLPEGIQIRHGHQLERIHRVDYDRMTEKRRDGTEILTLPWGTLWILEVMNPAKEERNYIDRIQPLGRFLVAGMIFDPRFVMRFVYRSAVYFVKHRIFTLRAWRERFRQLPSRVKEEIITLGGFDEASVRALRKMRGVHTLIVGHSHGPRYRRLAGNKLLVNTGTWMSMINLDIQYLGQDSGLTYAVISYSDEGKPQTSLMRWHGEQPQCETVPYAD
jgi:UDP-2,3-diacylglucosamine pyrophosphatase LpxH